MIDKILYTFLIAVYCLGMPCALVWSVRSGKNTFCPGVSRPGVSCPGVSRPGVSCPGVSRPGVSCPGVSRPGVSCPGVSELDPLYTSWLKSVEFQYNLR